MFKRLLARLFGTVQERMEAEEAYELEFGRPPLRGMTVQQMKSRIEHSQAQRASMAKIRKRQSPQPLVQDDPILNTLHPASPLNPVYHQPVTSSHRSHSSCDDSSSRHHGGHSSHHDSSSYDSGSSDSGSSGSCD